MQLAVLLPSLVPGAVLEVIWQRDAGRLPQVGWDIRLPKPPLAAGLVHFASESGSDEGETRPHSSSPFQQLVTLG